ncbi:MAG: hypothetical protein PHO92_05290 [Candidatus Peribacteraceae bacterium]|nr:hypothetical protein [Candidatus Peribacteraceae bacterium]
MSNVLYLTLGERKLFDALSAKLKEGWEVRGEMQTYKDSAEKRQVRLDLMELDDGRFEDIIAQCGPACSPEDLQQLVSKVDLTGLSARDLWEICFALGPDAMSYLISKLLVDVRNDDHLEGVMALTHLRHELLTSLQPA